ncbi:hypothetical protein [Halomonas ventosae]|uniref:Uncharacterized protein n=1 Tax=Halomonas ventosae TaxID=229007 RepID=A0A4R6HG72_9GAMM|nr:hypothetical protein [Halomonas ventosae]TDO07693.1 hypothetical protein DFO68_10858 [Halomonas ventosae]
MASLMGKTRAAEALTGQGGKRPVGRRAASAILEVLVENRRSGRHP